MVRVWDHTGSLVVIMLMHFSLTASNIILGPATTPGKISHFFLSSAVRLRTRVRGGELTGLVKEGPMRFLTFGQLWV